MQEVVQAINELTKAIISRNSISDYLIPFGSMFISFLALGISLYIGKKQNNIALLPAKEQTFKELNELMFYYITYGTSENPFQKNQFSYGSVVHDEEDILRRSNMYFSKETNTLVRKIADKHLEISVLNLEAQVYFDKLREEKGKKEYEELKRYVIETTPLLEFDLEREAKISELCYKNVLCLNEYKSTSNYYELRQKIRVANKELGELYFLWNQIKNMEFEV